ncbi:MAG: 3-isopropylmalate dehydrogenase, partial [Pirellulales bacterium]
MTDSAEQRLRRIAESSSYLLAEEDIQLLKQDELRPVRMQLELLKPEMILAANKIHSTIVVFGGTRIVERAEAEAELAELERSLAAAPDDAQLLRTQARLQRQLAKCKYYDDAREFGRLVSTECQIDDKCDHVIVTGGGPG